MIARHRQTQRSSPSDRDLIRPHRLHWAGLCFLVVALGIASAAIVPERAEQDKSQRRQSLSDEARNERRLTAGITEAFDGRKIILRENAAIERTGDALILSKIQAGPTSQMIFDIRRAPGGVPIRAELEIDHRLSNVDFVIIKINRFQEGSPRVNSIFRLDVRRVKLRQVEQGPVRSTDVEADADTIRVNIALPPHAQGGPMSVIFGPGRSKPVEEAPRFALRKLSIEVIDPSEANK